MGGAQLSKRVRTDIDSSGVDHVIVATTVVLKTIAYPTDSSLIERARHHLVGLAQDEELTRRQSYHREAPRLAAQIARYAHAKQYRRMKKSLRTLRSRVGRVMRDVGRQLEQIDPSRQGQAREILGRANRILTQQTNDKNKFYAFHDPEVECIAKGKARTPYEFGGHVTGTTGHVGPKYAVRVGHAAVRHDDVDGPADAEQRGRRAAEGVDVAPSHPGRALDHAAEARAHAPFRKKESLASGLASEAMVANG